MFKKDEGRWGSGGVVITGVTLRDAAGDAGHVFQSGQPMSIELAVKADKPCDDFVFADFPTLGALKPNYGSVFGFEPIGARPKGATFQTLSEPDLLTHDVLFVFADDAYPSPYH